MENHKYNIVELIVSTDIIITLAVT